MTDYPGHGGARRGQRPGRRHALPCTAAYEDQGLIQASDRKEAPDAGDERRNYYRLAPLGLRVAKAEARRLQRLTQAARMGGLLEANAS
ncbi:MAG: hypothetical protein ACR2HZ_09435 [Gemmatimonadaceae bacterium]